MTLTDPIETLREYMDICEAQSSEIAGLRARVAEMKAALAPFAKIKPSSAFASDGSEAEGYAIVVQRGDPDFTGADLARARSVLSENPS